MSDLTLPDSVDADDLHCPVCDYSLRGLPEPRCPECGYAFDWDELRERNRQRQAWFYEHSGTFKSHLKTRWRSLRPWSFWKSVHAYTTADVGRLSRYRGGTLVLLLLIAAAGAVMPGMPAGAAQWLFQQLPQGAMVVSTTPPRTVPYYVYPSQPVRPPGNRIAVSAGVWVNTLPSPPLPATSQPVRYFVPPPAWAQTAARWLQWRSYGRAFGRRAAYEAALPFVLTPALLVMLPLYWLVLRGSVLRAQIRPVHLARVGAYSADALPWLLLLGVVAQFVWATLRPLPLPWSRALPDSFTTALVMTSVVVGGITLRVASALRRYLRFPHAYAVAAGFGVIAGLVWTVVVLQVTPMY